MEKWEKALFHKRFKKNSSGGFCCQEVQNWLSEKLLTKRFKTDSSRSSPHQEAKTLTACKVSPLLLFLLSPLCRGTRRGAFFYSSFYDFSHVIFLKAFSYWIIGLLPYLWQMGPFHNSAFSSLTHFSYTTLPFLDIKFLPFSSSDCLWAFSITWWNRGSLS